MSTRCHSSQPVVTQVNPLSLKSTRCHSCQPVVTQVNPLSLKLTRCHTSQPVVTQVNSLSLKSTRSFKADTQLSPHPQTITFRKFLEQQKTCMTPISNCELSQFLVCLYIATDQRVNKCLGQVLFKKLSSTCQVYFKYMSSDVHD